MLLALGATAIVAATLLWELTRARVRASLPELAKAIRQRWAGRGVVAVSYDPGRELRAEQRARELLRSCVNEDEWAMYRDLGFLRVWAPTRTPAGSHDHPAGGAMATAPAGPTRGKDPAPRPDGAHDGAPYAYLLYPHRPIVAYVPQTGALLNEYCVAFPDEASAEAGRRAPSAEAGGRSPLARISGSSSIPASSGARASAGVRGPANVPAAAKPVVASGWRLPDADDVLAKWLALKADERRLIADANMHLPGRQIDPQQVHEDLARLARWERERYERSARGLSSVPAS